MTINDLNTFKIGIAIKVDLLDKSFNIALRLLFGRFLCYLTFFIFFFFSCYVVPRKCFLQDFNQRVISGKIYSATTNSMFINGCLQTYQGFTSSGDTGHKTYCFAIFSFAFRNNPFDLF